MVQTIEHCHIVRNDEIRSNEPIIKGTRTPVRAIVEMWRIGVSPKEIPQRLRHTSVYPRFLMHLAIIWIIKQKSMNALSKIVFLIS
ncbi:DUF433 domain-containing protein [Leptolyngbya ectocarpi]|uniref:DUF433 domain-containing protein n=1 Tax=Leptolyngbya ectocarpi TaxID=1202 RepID=UPI001D153865